ncbi:McrC family protein [Pelagibaculum spongiae]|uniref:Restriction endonuclease n=1 Tax=Pelagibaculum spongiae TaxID=2080658 RepID=A0A2V1GVW1_9GAMM|nr:McrC family protein [Pelagibaculum spongiae]PVZ64531.1 restriction endonuclease [Pelagibaculum spongiae]
MKHYCVFEYGHLVTQEIDDASCTVIPDKLFSYLEKNLLVDAPSKNDQPALLQLCYFRGVRALKVKNYVGVLCTPLGAQIEILPKTGKHCSSDDALDKARKQSLTMISCLSEMKFLRMSDANISLAKRPLFEIFISQFLQSVNQVVKRGLRSDYQSQQDNLKFQKGRLQTALQIKRNLFTPHKFQVEYDEYIQDRPENRLIKSALNKVMGFTRLSANQKLSRELAFALADVPETRSVQQDLKAIRLDRGMSYYQDALRWSELVLKGFSPVAMHGETHAISLLFPMEKVFEAYVAKKLGSLIDIPYQLQLQAQSKSLVTHGGQNMFWLKPDLLIKYHGDEAIVLDTKWKLLDSSLNNASDKYGLSQADFYQMYAYGQKFLKGQGEIYLIYPAHEKFDRPISLSFEMGDADHKLSLWVVPIVINPRFKATDLRLPKTCMLKDAFNLEH